MKKNYLLMLFVAIPFLMGAFTGTHAQTATATWALTAEQSATTTGTISAAPQGLSVISVTSYTAYNGPLGVPSQRSRVTSGWPQNSAYTANRYYEYAVTVSSGSFSTVNASLPVGGVSTGNLRVDIFYSTDNFATSTQLNTGGYLSLPNGSYINPAPEYTFPLNLAAGATLSVRVFPWYSGSDLSTSRYVVMQNVKITLSNDPLPLKLLSFNSASVSDKVKLMWNTTSESNMQVYEIQRAADVNQFASIAHVAANNRSSNSYSFIDDAVTVGHLFYRLKMIDKDGSFTYSPILSINKKSSIALSVYPNPVTASVVLSHPPAGSHAAISIADINGKIVQIVQVPLSATQSSMSVEMLPNGVYSLRFYHDGQPVSSIKFIKQ